MASLDHNKGNQPPAGPGQKVHTTVSGGRLANGQSIDIPVVIVHGPIDGPTVYVQAAVHGNEVNGVEVIRRFLAQLEPSELSGSVIAVPVANMPAFVARQRHTPWEEEDMNRVWPGQPGGSLSERMAHALYEGYVRQADVVVDLHSGYPDMVLHTVYMKGQGKSRQLAEVFGLPVLVQEEPTGQWEAQRFQNKLRNVSDRLGIPAITPELGGPGRFEEDPIEAGVQGLWNILYHLEIAAGTPQRPESQTTVAQGHLTKATATSGGLFVPSVKAGDLVELGQPLGTIYGIQRLLGEADVPAPLTGMVIAMNPNPTVQTGEMVALLGKVLPDDDLD